MKLHRIKNMVQNITNWKAYLAYKWSGRKEPNFTFHIRNGYQISVPREIQPEFKESFFEEAYLKHLPSSVFNIENPTILDVGANVGFFTMLAMLKFNNPRIISFEPMKRNFEVLQKNTSQVVGDYITLVNQAVSNTNGDLTLKFDNSQDVTTCASIFDHHLGADEEVVQSTTLADIINNYQLSKIDILKLDCEGAEYEIIYNASQSDLAKITHIAIETHQGKNNNKNTYSLAEYLSQNGFNINKAEPDFIWASKEK